MKYNGRLNKLEKKSRRGDDNSVVIKVASYDADADSDDQSRRCLLHYARSKLGMISFDEMQHTIIVPSYDKKEYCENLTTEQAKKIIEEFGE